MDDLARLIVEAVKHGMPRAHVAERAGVSRRTVSGVLARWGTDPN